MIFLARRTSFFGVYLIQLRKMVSINQGLAMSARFVEAPFKTNCFNFCTESKCFVFIFIPIHWNYYPLKYFNIRGQSSK